MELETIIDKLTDPAAYPHPVDGEVVCHQTHISVVFLAGDYAYKLKKPVDLGFLDYSTLEKREHFCEREVELNRRLAPDVYLDVVSVTVSDGQLCVGGDGEVVEWAVKMRRLPDEATLEARLARGEVTAGQMESVARRVAAFHAEARSDEETARYGRFETVAGNARENFEQTVAHVGQTVHRDVYARLEALQEAELDRLHDLIERRAAAGIPTDTHGDLRLDHVYVLGEEDEGYVIVDCIEFNDRFRYADPVADMAFLVMDLECADRRDLARAFAGAYFEAAGDREGAELLSFYVAYRAIVRAKVEGIKATEPEVDEADRAEACEKAMSHWLLALGRLEAPERRPAMVLVGGLPGTGKSTLARALAERAGFEVVDTDVVRKELAGLAPDDDGKAAYGEGIYTQEWSKKTYGECLRRAEALLFEGKRVIVDATFSGEARRQMFLARAHASGVRSLFLECQTSSETACERLAGRTGDVSDADWDVYTKMVEAWEAPSSEVTERARRVVSAEGEVGEVVERALEALREEGLW
jgi:hypothetical protein